MNKSNIICNKPLLNRTLEDYFEPFLFPLDDAAGLAAGLAALNLTTLSLEKT